MNKYQVPLCARNFATYQYFTERTHDCLLLVSSEEEAISAHQQIRFFSKVQESILYLPSFDTIPYDRVSPSQNILSQRAKILTDLLIIDRPKLLITNSINLLQKLPPTEPLRQEHTRLYKGMKFSIEKFANFLVSKGFNRSSIAIDYGEFAVRGEIVDLVLTNNAYRIHFNWELIESIKLLDTESQISSDEQTEILIYPASEISINEQTIANFSKNYLLNFGVNKTDQPIFNAIAHGRKFPAYEYLSPLFYSDLSCLLDYLKTPMIFYDQLSIHNILEHEHSYNDLYQSRIQNNKTSISAFYPALLPTQCYLTSDEAKTVINQYSSSHPEHQKIIPNLFRNPLMLNQVQHDVAGVHSDDISILHDDLSTQHNSHETIFEKLFKIIVDNAQRIIVIFYQSKSNAERIKQIITNYEYLYRDTNNLSEAKLGVINLCFVPLSHGFYSDDYLFISEQDIFGTKTNISNTRSSKRKLQNILTELDSLQEGQLVVHSEYGIGQFLGVKTINILEKPHDCLKILYADNDKLYVPVENIELIKKYGNFTVELDKLGHVHWQKRKSKLKNRITETAAELLRIAAKRQLMTPAIIEYPPAEFEKFCSIFQYVETEDQLKTIEDVKSDFTNGHFMDRLVCGDVGFGKTEVAMRAAFMIATNIHNPVAQIAVIVPTTILCKQHYSRFVERFKPFGINIVQLSRLVSSNESKKIKQQIVTGEARIVIGTHAMLATDVKFHDLQLIIIDEEQHFGVKQKERLKELKSAVHVLSLSATPIPRTLQMSMIGLKDLSLIATAPIDRLVVRTNVMPFDPVVIRDALLREHFRGGRSFYVCPRIKDIDYIEQKLKEMIPELTYKIAHGQMPASIVDQIMEEFCEGKFDILLSTTIIESGIDIAAANTLIIHKADQLGLGQLYQLRGRIGRSKVRAYAYLTVPNDKKITTDSMRRLNIIENMDSLGAGFMIASHDMDMRGFGNLVGEEQSGHIKEVGVELYQEMLDQQIALLKNEAIDQADYVPSINLGLPVFIPTSYINDSSLKLSIYKRIGNLINNNEVEDFYSELLNRFGTIPIELDNLLNIVKIKYICRQLNIESLDSGTQGFVIRFRKNADVADMVMKFVSKYANCAKIRPDNKLVFVKNLQQSNILQEASLILNELKGSQA